MRSRFQPRKENQTSPAPTTQGGTTHCGFFALALFGSKVPENFPFVAQHILLPRSKSARKINGRLFPLGPSSLSGPLILRKNAVERPLDNVNDKPIETICHLSAWRAEEGTW